jgi:hypothetical protein
MSVTAAQRLSVIDDQAAGILGVAPADRIEDVLVLAIGNSHFLAGQDRVVTKTKQEEIGLLLIVKDESHERWIPGGNTDPAVELATGAQGSPDIDIVYGPSAEINRLLNLGQVQFGRVDRCAPDQLRFDKLVCDEHINVLFATEFANHQPDTEPMRDQTLMLKKGERFSHRSAAHSESRRDFSLDKRRASRDPALKDRFFDRRERSLAVAGAPRHGHDAKDIFHISPSMCHRSSDGYYA